MICPSNHELTTFRYSIEDISFVSNTCCVPFPYDCHMCICLYWSLKCTHGSMTDMGGQLLCSLKDTYMLKSLELIKANKACFSIEGTVLYFYTCNLLQLHFIVNKGIWLIFMERNYFTPQMLLMKHTKLFNTDERFTILSAIERFL